MDALDDNSAGNKLSATDYAIITCNRDETIATWDHRAEKTFGWTAREAVGQKIFYLLLPPAPESIPSLTLTDVISTGHDNFSEQFNLSQLAQHKNGSTFKAHFLIFTVKDTASFIVLIRDLGKQQRLLAKINDSFDQQTLLDDVLKISVEPLPLSSQLEKILDRLFEVPQLQLLPRAAVFLAEADSDTFTLKARRGFSESITLQCACYPLGVCRYGQSAQYETFRLPSCTRSKSLDTCRYASSHGHYST
ncbi:MAG TPA: PAS domain-containing protein, partial [Desulfopila sp.]|nr:PAS domain-containing protein [Desulfopila sp.]